MPEGKYGGVCIKLNWLFLYYFRCYWFLLNFISRKFSFHLFLRLRGEHFFTRKNHFQPSSHSYDFFFHFGHFAIFIYKNCASLVSFFNNTIMRNFFYPFFIPFCTRHTASAALINFIIHSHEDEKNIFPFYFILSEGLSMMTKIIYKFCYQSRDVL